MDFRDALATFGGFSPEGTQIDERRMVLVFTIENEDGVEVEHTLPFTFGVCPKCDGKGSYVNPSIDAHGITSDEWENEWDDEGREDYLSGRYDMTCEECHGKRVSPVPSEPDKGSIAEHKAAWDAWCAWERAESSYRNERAHEIRWGY